MTLRGPDQEIDRFRRTCIRHMPDSDEVGFDFETLVPLPEEIRATLDDHSEQAKQIAKDATGYVGWYPWCVAHWGVKWNPSSFHEIFSGPGVCDIIFSTPWSFPQPVCIALASQFPALTGTVFATDLAEGWVVAGSLSNGRFAGGVGELTRELGLIIEQAAYNPIMHAAASRALAHRFAQLPSLVASRRQNDLEEVSTGEIWQDICAELPCEYARRLTFMFDAERYAAWHGEEDLPYGEFDEDERPPLEALLQSPENLTFLKADGRCYFEIDRQLLRSLARHLAYAWERGLTEDELADRFGSFVACVMAERETDELYEWAAHAVFRPGVHLDLSDDDTLLTSFARYADGLRQQALAFLECR
jgi:hypothetical protein